MNKKYTLQYSLMQAAYWVGAVAAMTFAERFLVPRGFTAAGVGVLFAIGYAIALVAEPLTASLADRENGISLRTQIMLYTALSAVSAAVLYFVENKAVSAVLFVICMVMSSVVQPLVNAVGFSYVNRGIAVDFSFARGIGSAAFVVSALLGGFIIESNPNFSMVLLFAGSLGGTVTAALFAPAGRQLNAGAVKPQPTSTVGLLKRYPALILLLIGNAFIFAAHNFINTYMLNYVEPLGYGAETIGILAALAALLEVPVMLSFSKVLLKHFDIRNLTIFSACMFTVKTFLLLVPQIFGGGIAWLYVSQALQMLAFAIYMPATSIMINDMLGEADQAKGQMLLTETQVVGTMLCTLAGGYGITNAGTLYTGLGFMAVTAVGAVVIGLFLKKLQKERAAK